MDAARIAGRLLASMFWREECGPVFATDVDEISPIAEMLGIDLAEAWQAGDVPSPQGYWDLHTKQQLLAIAKEVKLLLVVQPYELKRLNMDPENFSMATLEKLSKTRLIEVLMQAMPERDGAVAGIPMPKEIARAKQPKT
jgi:hypothetical protein